MDDEYDTYDDKYSPADHRNFHIDRETEVQIVDKGWVDGGENLTIFGPHNMIIDVKEDYGCIDNPVEFEHGWCHPADEDFCHAEGHKFDKFGFYVDYEKPYVPEKPSNPYAISGAGYGTDLNRLLASMRETRQEMQADMLSLQQETGPRYITYPVHVSRPGQVIYNSDGYISYRDESRQGTVYQYADGREEFIPDEQSIRQVRAAYDTLFPASHPNNGPPRPDVNHSRRPF